MTTFNFALAALLLPGLALANDGIGGVSAGGIVFRKTGAIAMKKEVLTVSHALISVDYEFVNESPADVEETIIFPLPAYPASEQPSDTYFGRPGGFSIKVDGRNVSYSTVVQASLDGVDVTAQLRKLGLTDAQIAFHPSFAPAANVAPFTAQQRQQLTRLKLIGEGAIGSVGPMWDIQVNYVWKQKFPTNKVVRVHHEYRPFVSAGPGESGMDDDTARQYCADAAFLKSWRKLAAHNGGPEAAYLNAAKVSYILKTGNTWKNGIEDFTLNVVKSDPSELVSLCFPGTFKKTDPKTYQVRLRNFKPERDLEVYFGNIEAGAGGNDGDMPVPSR
ncbi:hypothetical protein ASC94_25040 [Massilia sp. Root418]|jgi:hypothetical protein|uniref:DUF4424 family protein n=1 Tax=Massilia sp. Root418 TaxID=1736532 RepID=UPI0006FA8B8E|nr:DUF4424 family protein [Massilia sp. Root418]KQW87778.1 hypothetical protein ASC94_25040 [Massilia sp. Root418]